VTTLRSVPPMALCAMLLAPVPCRAAEPTLPAAPVVESVRPHGGQRGTEVVVQFRGQGLADLQGLLLCQPGLTVVQCSAGDQSDRCSITLQIAADCPLGAHPVRLRTSAGLSNLFVFAVGALPEVREERTNGEPQTVSVGCTIDGVLKAESIDRFVFDVPANTDTVCEIESMRLGHAGDLALDVLDDQGTVVASADDTALGRKDPWLHFQIAKAGRCEVRVRSAFGDASPTTPYRLHLGSLPRPTGALPCGGRAGETLAVQLLGDVPNGTHATVQLPDDGSDLFAWFPEVNGAIAPTPIWLHIGGPNNRPVSFDANSTAACEVPCAVHGVVGAQDGATMFRFAAKKGQAVELRVIARELRSPLDPVLTVRTTDGRDLTQNDDNSSPDSALRFDPPADGDYLAVVSDLLRGGSPEHFFRLELGPRATEPRLSMVVKRQEEPLVTIPAGGAGAALLLATRLDAATELLVRGLPPGVTAEFGPRMPGNPLVPLLLHAVPEAALAGALLQFGPAQQDQRPVNFEQTVALVTGRNNVPQLQMTQRALPIVVTTRAPFTVLARAPAVPVVRGAPLELPIEVARTTGFSGRVRIRAIWTPTGLTAGQATCATAELTTNLTIEASTTAPLGTFPCSLVASARIDGAYQYVALPFVSVQVIDPVVRAQLGKARTEQGKAVSLPMTFEALQPLATPCQAQLLGLPRGVSAAQIEIATTAKEATFELAIAADAACGRHRGLTVELRVPSEHGPLVHRFPGGELRIDAPLADTPNAGGGR
jgi:hypothetical protein